MIPAKLKMQKEYDDLIHDFNMAILKVVIVVTILNSVGMFFLVVG